MAAGHRGPLAVLLRTVRRLLTEAPAGLLLCAEPEGGMDAHGLVRGQDKPLGDNQHILRAVVFDRLAPRGPGAIAPAGLAWEALGQEPSPHGRPSCSGPLSICTFVCFCFAVLGCKFSSNISIPWVTVKFQFPLQNILRFSEEKRVYLSDPGNELDLGFLFCIARRQVTLFS